MYARRSVAFMQTYGYNTAMMKIIDVANTYQGLARWGRGAGVRPGNWRVSMVESGHVRDGWLKLDGLKQISLAHNNRTERHLLRPFDVLITARTGRVQAALVPPAVSRTMASVTLLVVRPNDPESGMGHYLWYFLTSAQGRAQMERRMTTSLTLTALSAKNLGDVEVPVPSRRELDLLAGLVETSEAAYESAVEAARLRREALRDAIIGQIGNGAGRVG